MHLRLETAGAVATLVIDRPEKRNAMSLEMWSAIPGLLASVPDTARVLLVQGGDHFSAGADISEFESLRSGAEGASRYGDIVHTAERAIALFDRPTIAVINGVCVGGGCEIALACDLRIASDTARFGITPAKLGIVYSYTSTKRLVEAVGPAWARQILFTAEIVDAATALRIGLVNELHPAAALPDRAKELAETVAARSRVSLRGAKTIIQKITENEPEDSGVHALYDNAVHSADYAEGVRAFLEKRSPKF